MRAHRGSALLYACCMASLLHSTASFIPPPHYLHILNAYRLSYHRVRFKMYAHEFTFRILRQKTRKWKCKRGVTNNNEINYYEWKFNLFLSYNLGWFKMNHFREATISMSLPFCFVTLTMDHRHVSRSFKFLFVPFIYWPSLFFTFAFLHTHSRSFLPTHLLPLSIIYFIWPFVFVTRCSQIKLPKKKKTKFKVLKILKKMRQRQLFYDYNGIKQYFE